MPSLFPWLLSHWAYSVLASLGKAGAVCEAKVWGDFNFSFVLGLPFDYSVTKSCLTLCDPKDAAHQASLSFNYLLEFAQSHAY